MNLEKTMTHQTKSILSRRISITALLTAYFFGLAEVPSAYSQTKQADGIDVALVDVSTVQRDPFWPVGYTPKWVVGNKPVEQGKVVEQVGSIDWDEAMKQVAIQGVSSRAGNKFFAVVNGQVKGAGETVSVQVDGVGYTWMIERISPPSSVKLRRVSAK